MNNELTRRFDSAAWMDTELEPLAVTIIGAGATGSHTAYLLSKYADMITIYDGDKLETHNLGTQLYAQELIGEPKIEALREMLQSMSRVNEQGYTRATFNSWSYEGHYVSPITIVCTDNLESRKLAFEMWESSSSRQLFIDIRMGGEYGQVYFVTSDNQRIAAYRKTFEGDFNDPICSLRLTLAVTFWACAIAVQGLNNFRAGLYVPFEQYLQGPTLAQTLIHADSYLETATAEDDDTIRYDRPIDG